MSEIDPIVWYYTLKTKTESVKLGTDEVGCLRAESTDINNQESNSLVERFNNLSFRERDDFLNCWPDYYYDPPRKSVEQGVRKSIEELGWFDEFELEYLLSPPDERYIGPGSKEWEEMEKRIEQKKRDGTYEPIEF